MRYKPRIPAGTTGKVGGYGWFVNGQKVKVEPAPQPTAEDPLARRRARQDGERVSKPRLIGERAA